MNNRYHIYTRLDAQKNRIPGSSVKRKTMPKVGSWVEDSPLNQCCVPYTLLTTTPADVTDDSFTVTLLCDAAPVMTLIATQGAPTTTIDEVVALLNAQVSLLGKFEVSDVDITLQLKDGIIACAGTTTFTVTVTP